MKVNVEMQWMCRSDIRGVAYYSIELLKNLVKRESNIYSINFFDGNNERNNRQYIDKFIPKETLSKISVYECNTISYKDIIASIGKNDTSIYNGLSFDQMVGFKSDIFHQLLSWYLPQNIPMYSVVTAHDIMPTVFQGENFFPDWVEQACHNSHLFLEKRNDLTIIAVSNSTKNDLMSYYNINPERIFITYLGYNKDFYKSKKNKEVLNKFCIDCEYILYLGALDPNKGVVNTIKSFDLIKEVNPDIKLVLAGGKGRRFEPFISDALAKSRYKKDIILTGYVTDEEKRALMSSAYVFLFPSLYEGFGLPVIEAMACGAPVVTSSTSSLPEVGGDAALYADPYNVEEIAYQVSRVIDDTALHDHMIARGYDNIKNFSWDKTAELTENIYRKAFEMKTGGK